MNGDWRAIGEMVRNNKRVAEQMYPPEVVVAVQALLDLWGETYRQIIAKGDATRPDGPLGPAVGAG